LQLPASILNVLYNSRFFNLLIYFTAFLLFSYVVIRAFLISFTTDEITTLYDYVLKNDIFNRNYEFMSANNHMLNTGLMWMIYKIFGFNIFMLRLPNVLAFAVYLFYSFKLIKQFEIGLFRFSAFILLCTNPFLLDFFSLARGYGISMAFLMPALYHLLLFVNGDDQKNIFLSLLLIAIGSMANLTLLYIFFPICVLLVATLIHRKEKLRILENKFKILLISALLLCSGYVLYSLDRAGSLFYGGIVGIWYDTVNSLLFMSLYFLPYSLSVHFYIKIFFIACLLSGGGFIIYDMFWRKIKFIFSPYKTMLILFLCCILFEMALHYLLGVKYLVGRTGMFFIPVLCLFCSYLINEKVKRYRFIAPLSFLIFFASLIHFVYCASLNHVLLWK